ncbi:MAG: endodeoxyribonuclease [Segetibacter sp.]|nr:endodeoxyribonuclease [Segetibacter sp.]
MDTIELWEYHPVFKHIKISSLGRFIVSGKKPSYPYIDKKNTPHGGYRKIRISIGLYTTKLCLAHRLVAETFIPNPENKPFINHINSVRDDNRIENLEWCTPKENTHHALNTGRLTAVIGSNNHSSKLTEVDVEDILIMLKAGYLHAVISEIYGIDGSAIARIKSNKVWCHVKRVDTLKKIGEPDMFLVYHMRLMRKCGFSYIKISKILNIHQSRIASTCKGESFPNILTELITKSRKCI